MRIMVFGLYIGAPLMGTTIYLKMYFCLAGAKTALEGWGSPLDSERRGHAPNQLLVKFSQNFRPPAMVPLK